MMTWKIEVYDGLFRLGSIFHRKPSKLEGWPESWQAVAAPWDFEIGVFKSEDKARTALIEHARERESSR